VKNVNKNVVVSLLCFLLTSSIFAQQAEEITERRITVSEFKDKMMGGWIGQMVGVGWGAPMEHPRIIHDPVFGEQAIS